MGQLTFTSTPHIFTSVTGNPGDTRPVRHPAAPKHARQNLYLPLSPCMNPAVRRAGRFTPANGSARHSQPLQPTPSPFPFPFLFPTMPAAEQHGDLIHGLTTQEITALTAKCLEARGRAYCTNKHTLVEQNPPPQPPQTNPSPPPNRPLLPIPRRRRPPHPPLRLVDDQLGPRNHPRRQRRKRRLPRRHLRRARRRRHRRDHPRLRPGQHQGRRRGDGPGGCVLQPVRHVSAVFEGVFGGEFCLPPPLPAAGRTRGKVAKG